MVNYICFRCKYKTNRKSRMINHLSKKNICKSYNKNIELNDDVKKCILKGITYEEYINDNILKDNILEDNILESEKFDKNYSCNYCDLVYRHKSSLSRHIIVCKKRNVDMNILKKENIELKEELNIRDNEIEELKSIIEKQKYIIKNNKYINNSTISHDNIHNKINVNNYLKPYIKHMSYDNYKNCIYVDNKPYFIPLLNEIYFNNNIPENHSIYCSNPRSDIILVYDNKWITKDIKDVLPIIVDYLDELLSIFIENIENNNMTYEQSKMNKLYYKYIRNKIQSDDDYKIMLNIMYIGSKNLNIKP